MTENNRDVIAGTPRHVVPGQQISRLAAGRPLVGKIDFPFSATKTQPGHGIGDQPQAAHAMQVITPLARLVAVHMGKEIAVMVTAQHLLHFARQGQRLFCRPLRQQAGMHQKVTLLTISQGLAAQPAKQFVPVRCLQDILNGVTAVQRHETLSHRQGVQIVVPQHRDQRITQAHGPAQHLGRGRAAVDQVAYQPYFVARGVEFNALKKFFQRGMATL